MNNDFEIMKNKYLKEEKCNEFIKEEYVEEYIRARKHIVDRLFEAKYELLLVEKMNQECEYKTADELTEKEIAIRITFRQIYISLVWGLVVDIKSLVDDTGSDTLHISKFKKMVELWAKEGKKDEINGTLRNLGWNTNKGIIKQKISNISKYRDKIIAHNIYEAPCLKISLNELEYVLKNVSELIEYLCFDVSYYGKREKDIYGEKQDFIDIFLKQLFD